MSWVDLAYAAGTALGAFGIGVGAAWRALRRKEPPLAISKAAPDPDDSQEVIPVRLPLDTDGHPLVPAGDGRYVRVATHEDIQRLSAKMDEIMATHKATTRTVMLAISKLQDA